MAKINFGGTEEEVLLRKNFHWKKLKKCLKMKQL